MNVDELTDIVALLLLYSISYLLYSTGFLFSRSTSNIHKST